MQIAIISKKPRIKLNLIYIIVYRVSTDSTGYLVLGDSANSLAVAFSW
jgi:hypothetical protein